MMERMYIDKACEATAFAVLVTNVGGWAAALAHSWSTGWHGNQFPSVWICLLGGVLAVQAYYVYKKPQLSAAAPFRLWLWLVYAAYMGAVAAILVVCYAIVPVPSSASISPLGWWAITWFPPVAFIAIYANLHWQEAKAAGATPGRQSKPAAGAGPVAEGAEATLHVWVTNPISSLSAAGAAATDKVAVACAAGVEEGMGGTSGSRSSNTTSSGGSGASSAGGSSSSSSSRGSSTREHSRHWWRERWARIEPHWLQLLSWMGWSSVFWALFLTLFLVVQAAWQAADYRRFPAEAYGQLVSVNIDSTAYTASLFLRCVGPSSSSLATFVLEADEGAPAATLFGLQDALAKGGRRSCAYDRLGLGWSDDTVTPGHLKRIPFTLKAVLAAAGVPRPYILLGHGRGGQLALQYASLFPKQLAGLALLDSFSDTAHHLQAGVIANTTDKWDRVAYTFLHNFPGRQLSRLSFLRVMAPLGFLRFDKAWRHALSTSTSGAPYTYQAQVDALMGSNKHYQGRWGEYADAVAALPDSLDMQLLLAAPNNGDSFWYGTGWADLSPLPVLVMPAATSLAAAGCSLAQSTCRQAVLAAPGQYLAKQVLAYRATLSSNASLAIMPGGHGFPWQDAATTASVLLQKFEGV